MNRKRVRQIGAAVAYFIVFLLFVGAWSTFLKATDGRGHHQKWCYSEGGTLLRDGTCIDRSVVIEREEH